MPKFLEKNLQAGAAKKGLTGDAADKYVFGAMNNMGAMKGNKETPKGAAMQAKHEADEKAKAKKKPAKRTPAAQPAWKGIASQMLAPKK